MQYSTRKKLLAEWRTDRNLVDVGGDNDEGVADDPNAEKFKNIKILRVIPSSEAEVRTAHEGSRAYACEIVPSGEPIELKDYRKYLTVGDSKGPHAGRDFVVYASPCCFDRFWLA